MGGIKRLLQKRYREIGALVVLSVIIVYYNLSQHYPFLNNRFSWIVIGILAVKWVGVELILYHIRVHLVKKEREKIFDLIKKLDSEIKRKGALNIDIKKGENKHFDELLGYINDYLLVLPTDVLDKIVYAIVRNVNIEVQKEKALEFGVDSFGVFDLLSGRLTAYNYHVIRYAGVFLAEIIVTVITENEGIDEELVHPPYWEVGVDRLLGDNNKKKNNNIKLNA